MYTANDANIVLRVCPGAIGTETRYGATLPIRWSSSMIDVSKLFFGLIFPV